MTRPIATHMGNPVGQAYQILHVTYVLVPVVAGLDKFFHLLVPWTQYLAPLFISLLPIPPEAFMRGVGIFEIIVGITVAIKPRYGVTWPPSGCGVLFSIYCCTVPGTMWPYAILGYRLERWLWHG